MAFPTTSIYADGSSLTGFTNSAYTNGALQTTGGKFTGAVGGFGSAQWNGGPFTETEHGCQVDTLGGSGEEVHLHSRDNAADGTADYYMLAFQMDGSGDLPWIIYRVRDNGDVEVTNILGATITAPVAPFGMAFTTQGVGATVTLETWYLPNGGSWTSQGSVGDSNANRRTNAGNLGIDIFDNVWRISNVFGGEITSGSILNARNRAMMIGTRKPLIS